MLDFQNIIRDFLSPIDFAVAMMVLLFIMVATLFRSQSVERDLKKTYSLNIAFKLLFSVVFATYYILVFKGGDTYAYWQSTTVLKNVFLSDFDLFLEIVHADGTWENYRGFFNTRTGYPMRFIFMEEESFFVCKLLVGFQLITFGSYIGTTLLLAYWMALSNWRLFTQVRTVGNLNKRWLAPLFLFIPSVSFWASGVSKDTFALIFIFNAVYHVIKLLSKSTINKAASLVWTIVYLFLLYKIRPFLLGAILLPVGIMYIIHLINKLDSVKFIKYTAQGIALIVVIFVMGFAYQRYLNESYLSNNSAFNNAIVIQQDFENNTATYGEDEGKRYNLGITSGSTFEIIRSIPLAITAGIFRPFLWEALRPSLIFNGLESILYIFLILRFLFKDLRKKMVYILSNQVLTFAIIFIFIIAFMTGFTSILFGVLVRLRAPLLPFLGLLLCIDLKSKLPETESENIDA